MDKVYVVMISSEADDSYYPDYTHVGCICSSKEKAEQILKQLCDENNGADSLVFNGAWVEEWPLDKLNT